MATVAFGSLFGVVWSAAVYRVTSGGQRDFTSVSLVVAAKYEVLCEHKHAQRGREMLVEMDPMRAAEQEVRRAREAEQARAAQQAPLRPQPGSSPSRPTDQQPAAATAAAARRGSGPAGGGPDWPLTGGARREHTAWGNRRGTTRSPS